VKAVDYMQLVRRMRMAQRKYFKLDPRTDMEKKIEALVEAKRLEKEVDNAEIDDIHNVVTESPIA
jgi:hypothetical protein